MKQLKTLGSDLRCLFDQNITVRHVAEFLLALDAEASASAACQLMVQRDFDVLGVRENGVVTGYVTRAELSSGKIGDHKHWFDQSDLLADDTPLLATLEALRSSRWKFVVFLNHVGGIVTRGDMQKAPVRMWLFGLITLIEMQLLRLIRQSYSGGAWKGLLSETRVAQASKIFRLRQEKGEALDLADCLQFGDKREIVLGTSLLAQAVGGEDPSGVASCLGTLETVRDRLAHGHDIVTGMWPELIDLAASAEAILRRCESIAAEKV